MWLLKRCDDGERGIFYLLPNKEYSIGRKDAPIILINDSSISRKHAVIDIQQSGPKEPTTLMLTDFSKYGTSVNGIRIKSPTKLKENDEIHFGQSHNKFRFTRIRFIVAASCLNDKEKKTAMMRNINHIGGEFLNEWNKQCTHLVMESLTFTIKAVCALACACPVVTSKYFEDLAKYEDPSKLASVQPSGYFPDIAEPSLKDLGHLFNPNAKRRMIFSQKKFMFLSKKQFKRLSPAIEMAGGIVQLKDNPDEALKRDCSSNDVIVLAPEAKDEAAASRDQNEWIQFVMMQLNQSDLRAVKESEVGLAILHLSLENYCNPRSSSDNSVAGTTSSQIMQETVADWASQWQGTAKTKLESKPVNPEFKKPADVLAGDTQTDVDKKRKRSAETSMYVTDTVPVDITLPFHLAKRSKKRSSIDSENGKESFKESPENRTKPKENISISVNRSEKSAEGNNSGKISKEKMINRSAIDSKQEIENRKKIEEGKAREKEEIEDIANSILEDDDFGIEEDLFALDAEVTSKRMRTTDNGRKQNESSIRGTDKSRISESQFTETIRKENAVFSDANFGRKTKDKNRVSDSQLVETVGNSRGATIDTDSSSVAAKATEKSRISESQYTDITSRATVLSFDGEFTETGTRDLKTILNAREVTNKSTDKSRVSEIQMSEIRSKDRDNEQSVKLSEKIKDSRSGWLGVTQKSMTSESQISEAVVQKSKKRRKDIGETERDKLDQEQTRVEDVFADSKDSEKQLVSNEEVTMLPLGFKNTKMNKPKIEVKQEIDPDIPDASTIVSFSALVKKKVSVVPKSVMYNPNVKNFKKFSKTSFPGKDRIMPKVIGGRDLVAFETDNQEKDQTFAEFRAVDEQLQREERYIDDLFKMEANNTNAKRRKR